MSDAVETRFVTNIELGAAAAGLVVDGVIDVADFGALAGAWLWVGEPAAIPNGSAAELLVRYRGRACRAAFIR